MHLSQELGLRQNLFAELAQNINVVFPIGPCGAEETICDRNVGLVCETGVYLQPTKQRVAGNMPYHDLNMI